MRVNLESPAMNLIEAPFMRLVELPAWCKLVATTLAGIITAVFGDMFGGIFAIYFLTSALDSAFGRRAAKRNVGKGEHSSYVPELARIGAYTKLAALGGVFVVWLICLWAMRHLAELQVPAEYVKWIPIAPAMLALAGVIDDLDSIYDHQRRLGGKPNRAFKAVITALRLIPDKLTGLIHHEEDEEEREHEPAGDEAA